MAASGPVGLGRGPWLPSVRLSIQEREKVLWALLPLPFPTGECGGPAGCGPVARDDKRGGAAPLQPLCLA